MLVCFDPYQINNSGRIMDFPCFGPSHQIRRSACRLYFKVLFNVSGKAAKKREVSRTGQLASKPPLRTIAPCTFLRLDQDDRNAARTPHLPARPFRIESRLSASLVHFQLTRFDKLACWCAAGVVRAKNPIDFPLGLKLECS